MRSFPSNPRCQRLLSKSLDQLKKDVTALDGAQAGPEQVAPEHAESGRVAPGQVAAEPAAPEQRAPDLAPPAGRAQPADLEPPEAAALAAEALGAAAPLEAASPTEGLWRSDLRDGKGNPIAGPPPFDEFVTSAAYLGQGTLSRRQWAPFRRAFSFDPAAALSPAKTITCLALLWGKDRAKHT
jgi:hypothetical protein